MQSKIKALLLFSLLLFVAGSVSAAALDCEEYDQFVGATTFSEPYVSGACYQFKWSHSPTANDFNNYVLHADGAVTIEDMNLSAAASSFGVCGVEPGDDVTLYIRAYDGNAEGIFCSFDYNVTATTGSVVDSAMFFTYVLFGTLAGIIGLVIMIALAIYAIKAFKIKIHQ